MRLAGALGFDEPHDGKAVVLVAIVVLVALRHLRGLYHPFHRAHGNLTTQELLVAHLPHHFQ